VSDQHTARNLLLRAVRTGAPATAADLADYDRLVQEWSIRPALATRIEPQLADARDRAKA
jgi:hypothetical protein